MTKRATLAGIALALGAAPAWSQSVAEANPSAPCCTIPAGTEVRIEIVEELGSETSHAGQLFSVRLAEPIIIDEHVVALVGAAGVGEVVHAAPANSMGRAGELILAARYVEAAGTRIPLRRLRFERSGAPGQLSFQMMNGGAWVNTTPGRDINVTPGTILTAQVATAVFAPVD